MGVWRIDVPGIPNVKVVIDWQAMLRVIFIFKRDNGLNVFLSDRIKIFPELIQELHAKLGHAIERRTSILLTSFTLAAFFDIFTSVA